MGLVPEVLDGTLEIILAGQLDLLQASRAAPRSGNSPRSRRFFMTGLDPLADFEREFDGRRRHMLSNQHTDGFIGREAWRSLTKGLPTIDTGTIADVLSFLPTTPSRIANLR